jgi:two-component system, OmpR family, sensor histidine kinase VicK
MVKKHKGIKYHQARAILSHISDGVVLLDRRYKIVIFNKVAATITGYHADEVIGKDYDQFVKISYQNKNVVDSRAIRAIFDSKNKKKFPLNSILINKKGRKVLVTGNISPFTNSAGGIEGYLIIFRDVTKEKEIDMMKTEFTSLASHQLRTPLTAVRWFIEELYNEQLGKLNLEQKDYLKQVMDSNSRMIKLVNDLLDVARLEAMRVSVEPVSTDLIRLSQDVIKDYEFIGRANNCQVVLEKPIGPLPRIKVDPSLVKEVLSNLVSNAIKYSHSGRGGNTVYVKIEKKEPDVIISVLDSGVGIPKNFYSQIFRKFSRAGNVTKIDTGGTGFGLYISKILVEISGGKIWFESKENKGTTFHFTLPLAGSKRRKGDRGLVSEEEGESVKI